MFAKKKHWSSIIAFVIIFSLMISTNSSAILASERETFNNNISIEYNKINELEGAISVESADSEEDFTMYYHSLEGNDFYSETYDKYGNFLNKFVKEGNAVVCYDIDGNVLAKTTFTTSNESNQTSDSAITPFAYVWDDNLYWASGSTEIYNFTLSVVVGALISSIIASLGFASGWAYLLADSALSAIAGVIIDKLMPVVYYDGWKQYGWDTGFSIIRVNLDFYRYGHYNGYIGNYNKIIPNH